jgi:hypothetical protein
MRIPAALAIGIDIQLNLPHAVVQLLLEGRVPVIEPLVNSGVFGLPKSLCAGLEACVIAVMCPDHLDLIEAGLI